MIDLIVIPGIVIITIILIAIFVHLEPKVKKLKTGEWLVRYNIDRRTKERRSKIIKCRKQ